MGEVWDGGERMKDNIKKAIRWASTGARVLPAPYRLDPGADLRGSRGTHKKTGASPPMCRFFHMLWQRPLRAGHRSDLRRS
ncbi:MAG: hypothetical protein VX670_10970, partial [Candidatus Latescibacterota bacterium]|nr:hypothetical protein [Candidatus Latescibacterota bacterium]